MEKVFITVIWVLIFAWICKVLLNYVTMKVESTSKRVMRRIRKINRELDNEQE